jgi:hypothetical protein
MINGLDILLISIIAILIAENKRHKKQAELWRSTAKTINKILNSK